MCLPIFCSGKGCAPTCCPMGISRGKEISCLGPSMGRGQEIILAEGFVSVGPGG